MKIGIIGGGMMGLTTAYYLIRSGIHVTILEKEKKSGGLSRSMEIAPGIIWDRYYHVILSTDTDLIDFIHELGLPLEIVFKETNTGFFTDGQLHSLSSTAEFLKFRPLSMIDKLRLGAGIFFASHIRDGNRLESIYAKTWLIRVFGRRNYEKMWAPLLRSKLGPASARVSGAFIWAIIKRYYGTRQKGSKKEIMGCVSGGYHSIIKKIHAKLKEKGAKVVLSRNVKKLSPLAGGKWKIDFTNGKPMVFDKVVATIPNPNIIEVLPNPKDQLLVDNLRKIKYLNLVCVTLLLKSGLSSYYVTNLTDSGFPFTGIIDATNIVPEKILGGRGLIYLPRWMPAEDTFYQRTDSEIYALFHSGLKRIFPDFSEDDIIKAQIHREVNVQPIQTLHYRRNVPPMKTGLDNLYMVNTTMILNSTLNNNQVIRLGREMAHVIMESINE
jgi:protoporphyrinogen oxidase